MELELDPIEARVLGCLIEKELTTPDSYPLTLNALVTACNQKSNRNPVLDLDDVSVLAAIDSLKIHTLVMAVHPPGSRAAKYKHATREKLDWIDDEIAILCELFIRGPQTVGELRTHCERLHPFTDLDDVRDTLVRLAGRQVPLVVELPRQPGKKEPRWAQLLTGPIDTEALAAAAGDAEPARLKLTASEERIAGLEADVATLQAQVQSLSERFDQFKQQFE